MRSAAGILNTVVNTGTTGNSKQRWTAYHRPVLTKAAYPAPPSSLYAHKPQRPQTSTSAAMRPLVTAWAMIASDTLPRLYMAQA